MKIKLFFTLLLAGGLMASAQSQGYKDGIEYYKAGQYENAKTILERTLNDASTDKSLANYYLGQVALAKGDKAAAKSFFDQGQEADPANPYNYVGLGALDLLNNNVSSASDYFKEAKKLAKKDSEVIVAIARAYYNTDPVKYAKEIQSNIDKARKDSKNMEPSIYILEGDMLYDAKDYGQAAARYENAITNDPDNSEGYVKFANAYFNVNKNFGIEKLEELLAKQPNSAMAQRELAEKYFLADHWRKASDLYGKYIQNPNHFPEDKARYAVLLYWGENYPESLRIAEEILAGDPSNFLMQRIQFLDNAALKNFDAAKNNAENFFAKNPNAHFTTNDFVTYADVLSELGQDSLAVVQYEIAAQRDPKNGELLKNLSSVYSKNQQYGKSAEAYDAYLKLQEKPSLNDLFGMSGRYLNAAAYSKDTTEQKELAGRGIEYVKQVIERTPEVSPVI
ncbi:MAG: tetratricopeptide repeat protein, partial [Muribaculaceae bacterium]|nr:tetratricopeptide repeat protein [Muribaculaceae bacterium]